MGFTAGTAPRRTYLRQLIVAAVITLIFGGVGTLLTTIAAVTGGHPALWIVGIVFLVAGLIGLIGLIGMARERLAVGRDAGRALQEVVVGGPLPSPTTRSAPWSWPDLVRGVAAAFEDSPYVVHADDHRVRITADLTDARWIQVTSLRTYSTVFAATLTRKRPGLARRNDLLHHVETTAGPLRLGAIAAVRSGRSWFWKREVQAAIGPSGFQKVVDIDFSTSDINGPLQDVVKAAGWKQTLDAESKLALAMALLGGSSIIIVPLALLASWLLDR
ncbi:hypothetical protein [Brachybacterium phenoliresistens]|uniref:hypothetical protein n=1 Tax=Brachybacterium phenoliresistens TaxID=396014 RepID=UPI0031D2A0CA